MSKLFGGYLMAQNTDGKYGRCPVTLLAVSKAEAVGKAIEHAVKVMFPQSEGYFNHAADVVEINDEQYQKDERFGPA